MELSTWLAIIAAVFGGAGVKVIEKWLNRGDQKDDSATKLRSELREELNRVKTDTIAIQTQLDETRAKYYALMEQFSRVKLDLDEALYRIKKNADEASADGDLSGVGDGAV